MYRSEKHDHEGMALFIVKIEKKYAMIKSLFHYDMQPLSKEICYLPFSIPTQPLFMS